MLLFIKRLIFSPSKIIIYTFSVYSALFNSGYSKSCFKLLIALALCVVEKPFVGFVKVIETFIKMMGQNETVRLNC